MGAGATSSRHVTEASINMTVPIGPWATWTTPLEASPFAGDFQVSRANEKEKGWCHAKMETVIKRALRRAGYRKVRVWLTGCTCVCKKKQHEHTNFAHGRKNNRSIHKTIPQCKPKLLDTSAKKKRFTRTHPVLLTDWRSSSACVCTHVHYLMKFLHTCPPRLRQSVLDFAACNM